jgi:hypothetical protein
MTLSRADKNRPAKALFIIAPVGAYLGRVKNGISQALNDHGNRNADIELDLIISEEYSTKDSEYEIGFVEKLSSWVESTWKDEFPKMRVERIRLPVTERDRCMLWLIEELCSFFRSNPEDAVVSIDLTSAPREWFFVAMDICQMFDNVEFYNVRPTIRSLPSSFIEHRSAEIEDWGTLVETVKMGSCTKPLRQWLHSIDEDGYPNEHCVLFRTMWELAGKDAYRSDDVYEHFKANCLSCYDQSLKNGKRQTTGKRGDVSEELRQRRKRLADMQSGAVKKKIGRYFVDIEAHGLFKEVMGKYEFTEKGKTLAKGLFESSIASGASGT